MVSVLDSDHAGLEKSPVQSSGPSRFLRRTSDFPHSLAR